MPVLSDAEKLRLAEFKQRAEELRAKIARWSGPALGIEATLRELDQVLASIAEIEAKYLGVATAQQVVKSRVLRRVARQQLEAARFISSIYLQEARRLGARLLASEVGGIEKMITRAVRNLATARDERILESIREVGSIAKTMDHDLAIRVFGAEVRGQAGAIGISLGGGVDRAIVERVWEAKPDGLQWLLRTSDSTSAEGLVKQAQDLIALGKNARTQYQALKAAGLPEAKLSKWVEDLYRKAKDAVDGDASMVSTYREALQAAKAYVAELKKGPLGTQGAGKRLLAQLDKAVRAGDADAMDAAVKKWIGEKARYNSVLAMRTATNETYRAQINATAKKRPWVYAIKRILSDSHPRPDECDLIAAADFGLGPGVYAIDQVPDEHPSGLCVTGGSLITTARGNVRADEVLVGDLALTHRGRFMPVTRCYRRERNGEALLRLQVRVERSRSLELELTAGHPVLAERGWTAAGDLRAGTRIAVRSSALAQDESRPTCDKRGREGTDSAGNGPATDAASGRQGQCGASPAGASPHTARRHGAAPSPTLWQGVRSSSASPLLFAGFRPGLPGGPSSLEPLRTDTAQNSIASERFDGQPLVAAGSLCRSPRTFDAAYPNEPSCIPPSWAGYEASPRNSKSMFSSRGSAAETVGHRPGRGWWRSSFDRAMSLLRDTLESTWFCLRAGSWLRTLRTSASVERCAPSGGSQTRKNGASDSIEQRRIDNTLVSAQTEYGTLLSAEQVDGPRMVYNFEVAEDHSYFAGGVAVHNCRDEPVIDARYFQEGGVPLAWKLPRGYADAVEALGAGGRLAKLARKAETRAAIKDILSEARLAGEESIELVRSSEAGADNLIE